MGANQWDAVPAEDPWNGSPEIVIEKTDAKTPLERAQARGGRRLVGLVVLSALICLCGVVMALQYTRIAHQEHRIHALERENKDLLERDTTVSVLHVESTVMFAFLGFQDDSTALAGEKEKATGGVDGEGEAGVAVIDTTAPAKRGVTWVIGEQSRTLGGVLNRATCWGTGHRCDAYEGDTPCTESLPLLCLKKEGLPRPDYSIRPNPMGAMPADFYEGWTGGRIGVTQPVVGSSIQDRQHADQLCERDLGAGYQWADHKDGGGGWNWWAYGAVPAHTPFWTSVIGQNSACFD